MRKKRALTSFEKTCIKKYFFDEFKNIVQHGDKRIKTLGLEASLEALFANFENGDLKLKIFNKNEFFVFLVDKKTDEYQLIYDSKKILV